MSKLILIPTPIGNLGDITLRAIDALKGIDVLLAEDTRTTGKLLKHLGIQKKMLAHHQNNEHTSVKGVLDLLNDGKLVGMVTDAGTPGISDPGFLIVRECIKHEIPVEVLPGPTAFVPALILSGLPADRFVFEGFLPHKKGRLTRITKLADEPRTMIFYESPHRLVKTLDQLGEAFGTDRMASVTREISKVHEETVRGTLYFLKEHFSTNEPRGEIVLVVAGNDIT